MGDDKKMWPMLPRYGSGYINGVNAFLQNAFANFSIGEELWCPCKKCHNVRWHCRADIYDPLVFNGIYPTFQQWVYDVLCMDSQPNNDDMDCEMDTGFGDNLYTMLCGNYKGVNFEGKNKGRVNKGPNGEAKMFYRLVNEGKQPLYPRSKDFSRLSFIFRLYFLKYSHGITESAFSDQLQLLKEAFPNASIPKSFNETKNIIKDLGLDYQRIHSSPNDCMLYWGVKENEEACRTCGLSRWKVVERNGADVDINSKINIPKIPVKLMRYFPLKPRLQRLFMCKEFSKLMRWHAVEQKRDGKLRHAANGEAWKNMDECIPNFHLKFGMSDWV